jgi:hypothetical protein
MMKHVALTPLPHSQHSAMTPMISTLMMWCAQSTGVRSAKNICVKRGMARLGWAFGTKGHAVVAAHTT